MVVLEVLVVAVFQMEVLETHQQQHQVRATMAELQQLVLAVAEVVLLLLVREVKLLEQVRQEELEARHLFLAHLLLMLVEVGVLVRLLEVLAVLEAAAQVHLMEVEQRELQIQVVAVEVLILVQAEQVALAS